MGEVAGGAGNSPRVTIRGVLTGDDVSIVVFLSSSPTMAGGMSWGDDRREKGDVAVPVDAFTGVDGALFSLVDIALIMRDGGVAGHERGEVGRQVGGFLYSLVGFESQLVTPAHGDPRS